MSYKIFIPLLLLFLCNSSFAQLYSDSRTITKAYKISAATTVDITNKYGKVHLKTWEKDSVKFEIQVRITADNRTKYNKLKSGIDFEFVGTEFYVMAKTVVGSKYVSLLDELKGLTNEISDIFSQDESELKINYTVYAPVYVNINISNKYGDVYVNNHKGDFKLSLAYGDFKANKLTGDTDIEINFGDAFVYEVSNAKINLSYSEFQLKKANQLNMNTKSSKIDIDEVRVIKLISKRDKFYIDQLSDLFGESSFSEFWIYNLNSQVNLNIRYGHLKLESIKDNFSYLNLNSRFADLDFFIPGTASYSYEIIERNATLLLPPTTEHNEDRINEKNDKQTIHSGKVGKIPPKSQIKIEAESGYINIYKQ